jgi:lysosomal acid lipase/cholesteryl ester hydrolase
VNPKLNEQVNVFIALAPAMSPAGLHNSIVDALVKASPQVLFLLFGRRSILSSATMWQSILYPPLFCKVIDLGLGFLFNWRTKNISTSQKLAAYPHLYSFTSTKSVVHWFQIIRNKSFQMYDDDIHAPISISRSKHTRVAKYPTRNIKTPIVLVYGGSDSLVDIKVMLRELPRQTVATEISHYEHLDFLWARDVDAQVFQHVFDALQSFTGAEHTTEEYERYRIARHSSLVASGSFRRHRHNNSDVAESDVSSALAGGGNGVGTENGLESPRIPNAILQPHQARETHSSGLPRPRGGQVEDDLCSSDPSSPIGPGRGFAVPSSLLSLSPDGQTGSDTPLGTDGTGDRADGESPTTSSGRWRNGGGTSHLTLNSMREGKGIKLGVSRAIGGVTTSAEGVGYTGSSDEGKSIQSMRRKGK